MPEVSKSRRSRDSHKTRENAWHYYIIQEPYINVKSRMVKGPYALSRSKEIPVRIALQQYPECNSEMGS